MSIPRLQQLFKKLSVIDIVLLAIVGLFAFLAILYSRREVQFITLRLKITDEDVLYSENDPGVEYANSFVVGDSEENELGQKVAEIVGVESYNIDEDKRVVILSISAKAVYNPRKQQYSLRGKPVTFGSVLTFNFSQVRAKGIVTSFPGYEGDKAATRENKKVQAQLRWENREFSDTYGVPEFVATAIRPGDEVKDSSGQVLAKVLEVRITPAQRSVLSNGVMRVVNDPLLKDVYYTIELSTYQLNGRTYMFDYLPVLIHEPIPLNFSHISVFPLIMEIQ